MMNTNNVTLVFLDDTIIALKKVKDIQFEKDLIIVKQSAYRMAEIKKVIIEPDRILSKMEERYGKKNNKFQTK